LSFQGSTGLAVPAPGHRGRTRRGMQRQPWSLRPGWCLFPFRSAAVLWAGEHIRASDLAIVSSAIPFVLFFGQEVFVQVGVLGRVVASDVVARQDRGTDDLGANAFRQRPPAPADLDVPLPALDCGLPL